MSVGHNDDLARTSIFDDSSMYHLGYNRDTHMYVAPLDVGGSLNRDWQRRQKFNAAFECGGERFYVNVTDMSYGWQTASTGSAQARLRYVWYPKRVEQSNLNVTLQFFGWEDYRDFHAWMYKIMESMLSTDHSKDIEDLFFATFLFGRNSAYMGDPGNFDGIVANSPNDGIGSIYKVIPKEIQQQYSYDTVAPSMDIELIIYADLSNDIDVEHGSNVTGDPEDLPNSGTVKDADRVDDAFTQVTKNFSDHDWDAYYAMQESEMVAHSGTGDDGIPDDFVPHGNE